MTRVIASVLTGQQAPGGVLMLRVAVVTRAHPAGAVTEFRAPGELVAVVGHYVTLADLPLDYATELAAAINRVEPPG